MGLSASNSSRALTYEAGSKRTWAAATAAASTRAPHTQELGRRPRGLVSGREIIAQAVVQTTGRTSEANRKFSPDRRAGKSGDCVPDVDLRIRVRAWRSESPRKGRFAVGCRIVLARRRFDLVLVHSSAQPEPFTSDVEALGHPPRRPGEAGCLF